MTATDADLPLFVLLNRGSGAADARERERIVRAGLQRAGRRHDIEVLDDPARLPATARALAGRAAEAGGAMVVAGGDGTINAVLGPVLDSGAALGVLPQGTFNFTGRDRGMPEALAEAVRVLVETEPRHVQVGRVNERHFLVNASLGLYPQLLEDREAFKQSLGRSRTVAVVAGAVSLLRRRHRFHLEVACDGDAMQLDACTLVVGNNRLQLEEIGLDDARAVEHGSLMGITVQPVRPRELLMMAARGLLGRLGDDQHARHFAFTDMHVRSGGHGRIKVALDGEICRMRLPLHLRVDHRPLRMLVPRRRRAGGGA